MSTFAPARQRPIALVACLCLLLCPLVTTAEARLNQVACDKLHDIFVQVCATSFKNNVIALCGPAFAACGCAAIPSPISLTCLIACGAAVPQCISGFTQSLIAYDNCLDSAQELYDQCIDDIVIECT